jgi:hypothetical protein
MVMRFDSKEEDFMIRIVIAAAALGVAAAAPNSASADWTIDLGQQQFNDSQAFGGSIWMTFKTIVNGTVQITIENNATAPVGENGPLRIMQVVFNIDPALFGLNATFAFGPFVGPQPPATNGFEISEDDEFISPEQMFDGSVKYQNDVPDAFTNGESSIFTITSSNNTFTEDSFRFLNTGDGFPDFIAGVHYGWDNGGSGKSGAVNFRNPRGGGDPDPVPLPASIAGLLIAGVGLFTVRRTFCIV